MLGVYPAATPPAHWFVWGERQAIPFPFLSFLFTHPLAARALHEFARAAVTKYYSLGGLTNRNLFLTI